MAFNELDLLDRQIEGQKDIQRESSDQQGKLYAPQLREQLAEAQAAIINQTNPSRALKIMIEGFRGNIVNTDGDLEQVGFPLMNEKGISHFSSILLQFINDPNRFGNISRFEVRNITLQTIDDITMDLGIYWRDYGIKDSTMRDIIIDAMLTLILITLTRSEEQGEKNWLSRIVLESVSQNRDINKKRTSGVWERYFKL